MADEGVAAVVNSQGALPFAAQGLAGGEEPAAEGVALKRSTAPMRSGVRSVGGAWGYSTAGLTLIARSPQTAEHVGNPKNGVHEAAHWKDEAGPCHFKNPGSQRSEKIAHTSILSPRAAHHQVVERPQARPLATVMALDPPLGPSPGCRPVQKRDRFRSYGKMPVRLTAGAH